MDADAARDGGDGGQDGGGEGGPGGAERGRRAGRNRAPTFLNAPPTEATEEQPYRFAAQVDDLDGDILTFAAPVAPEGLRVGAESGAIYWRPGARAAGSHPVTLRVTDEAGATAELNWTIVVARTNSAPKIRSRPEVVADPGARWTYAARADDGDGDALTWSVMGPPGMAVGADGALTWMAPTMGSFPVRLSVSDGTATDAQTFTVTVRGPAGAPPAVRIDAPAAGAALNGRFTVQGAITDDTAVADWTVAACRTADAASCRELRWGTGSVTGELATGDTATLEPGAWTLRVRARDSGGMTGEAARQVTVEAGAQAGVLRVGFVDLAVPQSGLMVQITREYNGAEPTVGEWGLGWRLATNYQAPMGVTPRLELPPMGVASGWRGGFDPLAGGGYVDGDPRPVRFTLPDGRRFDFVFSLRAMGAITGLVFAHEEWMGPSGASVETLDASGRRYTELGIRLDTNEVVRTNTDGEFLGPYAPARFVLETPVGERYTFRVDGTLESWRDETGAMHTWMGGGGAGLDALVTVARNAAGRITALQARESGERVEYEYDAAGDMVRVRFVGGDFDGEEQTFAYDSAHRMRAYNAPGVRLAQMEYDEQGRIVRVTDGTGAVTEYEYRDGVQVVTAPGGAVTRIEHDARGNVTAIRDPRGGRTEIRYDAEGRESARVDPEGGMTQTRYAPNGNIQELVDGEGVSRAIDWTPEGRITGFDDANGAHYGLEFAGDTVTVRGPDGRMLETLRFDADGAPLERRDAQGRTASWRYDATGLLLEERTMAGEHLTYTYERRGLVQHGTDMATGQRFTNRYDVRGELRGVEIPGMMSGAYTFDLDGMPREATVDGHRYRLQRDGAQRVRGTTVDGVATAQTRRDADGHVVSEVLEDGSVVRYDRDAAGNAIAEHRADGVTRHEYSPAGRRIVTVTPDGHRTEYAYDRAGRLRETRNPGDPGGPARSFEYDTEGRFAGIRDVMGRPTRVAYDAYGRPAGMALPGRGMTMIEFEAASFEPNRPLDVGERPIRRMVLPSGDAWEYERDGAGRVTAVLDPERRRTEVRWDASGEPTRVTLPGMREWLIERDGDARPTRLRRPSGSEVVWRYSGASEAVESTGGADVLTTTTTGATRTMRDADNRTWVIESGVAGPARTQSASATLEYSYDSEGRVRTVASADGARAEYRYDVAGRLEALAVRSPSGETFATRYEYEANRLARVVDPRGGVTHYRYDPVGRLTEIARPGGSSTLMRYGMLERPDAIEHRDAAGAVTQRHAFTYDASGRVATYEGPGGSHRYTYNRMGWLERDERAGGPVVSYRYDAAGNVTERAVDGAAEARTYDADDRLTAVGGAAVTYDARGNQTSGRAGAQAYDGRNQLVSAGAVRYGYDAQGNLVERAEGTQGARRCLAVPLPPHNLPTCVLEYDGAGGGNAAAYVFDAFGVAGRFGGPGGDRFALRGLQQSVVGLADTSSGAAVAEYDYDAWGVRAVTRGEAFLYGYDGERTDATTGYVYLRSRWYDPATGRFLTEDRFNASADDPRTFNRYRFVPQGAPLNLVDPTGQFGVAEISISSGIQNTLQSLRTAAVQCARRAAINAVTDAVIEWVANQVFQLSFGWLRGVVTSAAIGGTGAGLLVAIGRLLCGSPDAQAGISMFGGNVEAYVPIDGCGRRASLSGFAGLACAAIGAVTSGTAPNMTHHIVHDGTDVDVVLGGAVALELKADTAFTARETIKQCRFSARNGGHMLLGFIYGQWPPNVRDDRPGATGRRGPVNAVAWCARCWNERFSASDGHCRGAGTNLGSAFIFMGHQRDRTNPRNSGFRLLLPQIPRRGCVN